MKYEIEIWDMNSANRISDFEDVEREKIMEVIGEHVAVYLDLGIPLAINIEPSSLEEESKDA